MAKLIGQFCSSPPLIDLTRHGQTSLAELSPTGLAGVVGTDSSPGVVNGRW